MESNELARKIVEILEDNKAEDIVLMEMRDYYLMQKLRQN